MTLGAVWLCVVVGAQLRCVDAAHTGARALARGESAAAASAAASRIAPSGAAIGVSRADGLVSVEVRVRVRGLRGTPGIDVHAVATAADEATVGTTGGSAARGDAAAGQHRRVGRAGAAVATRKGNRVRRLSPLGMSPSSAPAAPQGVRT
jgi:hypothetical protein